MRLRIIISLLLIMIFIIYDKKTIYAIPPAAPPPREKPYEPPEPPPPVETGEPEPPIPPGEPSSTPKPTPTPCIPAPCFFKVTPCCFSMGCLLLGKGSNRCDIKNVQRPMPSSLQATSNETKQTIPNKEQSFYYRFVQFLISLF